MAHPWFPLEFRCQPALCLLEGHAALNPGRCDEQGTLAKPLEYLCVESKRGGAPETSHRQWEGRSHARIPPCVEERNYYSDRKCPLRTKRERKSNKTLHLVALWHNFSSADKKAGGYKSFQSEKEKCKKKKLPIKEREAYSFGACGDSNRTRAENSLWTARWAPGRGDRAAQFVVTFTATSGTTSPSILGGSWVRRYSETGPFYGAVPFHVHCSCRVLWLVQNAQGSGGARNPGSLCWAEFRPSPEWEGGDSAT